MEEPCNQKWQDLLKIFKAISRFNEGAKTEYKQLIEVAKLDNIMTLPQKSGIIERCRYQISLIENPSQRPFANFERKEDRNAYQLSNTESNGK